MPATLSNFSTAQQANWYKTIFGNNIPLQYAFGGGVQMAVGAAGTANAYQTAYGGTLSVVNPTPTVLNLTASLIQPDGTTGTFADLLLVCLSCPTTNTDYITYGGGSNPVVYFTTAQKVYPGQTINIIYPVANGLAVTATTADRINLNSNSGTQVVNVLLAGH